MNAGEIFDFLCEKYPLQNACDFDNPGFLVGDRNTKVNSALVSLDCDLKAVEAAKEKGCQLIITHHPVIFEGLKNVTSGSVVYELIKSGISVISFHTNLDIAPGGVNDCLAEKLGFKNIKPFAATDGFLLREAQTDITSPDKLAMHIKKMLGGGVKYVAGRDIKRLLICSGSGGEYLDEAIKGGFDALVTADVKHHLFVRAADFGISLFDAGHYNTENVVVEPLAEMLGRKFADTSFFTYNSDTIKNI